MPTFTLVIVWKLVRNSIELIIYVEPSFMQVCAPQLSRSYCIFVQPANNNVWKRLLFNLTDG